MGKRMGIGKKEIKERNKKGIKQESNIEASIISVFAILSIFLVFLALLMPNFLLIFNIFMLMVIGMTVAIIIEHIEGMKKKGR